MVGGAWTEQEWGAVGLRDQWSLRWGRSQSHFSLLRIPATGRLSHWHGLCLSKTTGKKERKIKPKKYK